MPDTKTDFEKMPIPDALKQFGVDPKNGLSAAEAAKRLTQHGANALEYLILFECGFLL